MFAQHFYHIVFQPVFQYVSNRSYPWTRFDFWDYILLEWLWGLWLLFCLSYLVTLMSTMSHQLIHWDLSALVNPVKHYFKKGDRYFNRSKVNIMMKFLLGIHNLSGNSFHFEDLNRFETIGLKSADDVIVHILLLSILLTLQLYLLKV